MKKTFSEITFIVAFVSIVITIGESLSVDDCNKVWESKEIYKGSECRCMQDIIICKFALVTHLTCEKDTLLDYYKNLSNSCDVILSDCSSSGLNECSKGMCECFTTFIDCMNQKKCTPLPTSVRIRNFGSFHDDFVRGNFAEVADDLKNEE
uniref:Uncharacterized protein n=1 Tax=Meloidogyne enterolobii TaxID=390850 RepID=A0A6V7TKA4_MELEN|nr:unnamed protein product [Meloidogyne enterolobii]